jgi:hypothetical protein
MIGGDRVSARERGRTRAREQAARMGRDAGLREWASEGANARASRSVGPNRRKEKSARVEFLFFFFKNANSVDICLFHLKFCRAPKIMRNFV